MSPLEANGKTLQDSEFVSLSKLRQFTEIDATILNVVARDSKVLHARPRQASGISIGDFPRMIPEFQKRTKHGYLTFPWEKTGEVWSLTRQRRDKTSYTIKYYPPSK